MLLEEIPFHVFLERHPHLKNRPLNEQTFHYQDFITQCQMQLRYLIDCAIGKSATPSYVPIEPFSGFLLQENDFYLLQEDGSRIYL